MITTVAKGDQGALCVCVLLIGTIDLEAGGIGMQPCQLQGIRQDGLGDHGPIETIQAQRSRAHRALDPSGCRGKGAASIGRWIQTSCVEPRVRAFFELTNRVCREALWPLSYRAKEPTPESPLVGVRGWHIGFAEAWLVREEARCNARDSLSSGAWAMASIPVDDLRAGGSPHTLVLHHIAQHLVQAADAERLTHEPRVQVQHQQPPVSSPLMI